MKLPKAAPLHQLKPLSREVRERLHTPAFVPNPWTPADTAAMAYIASSQYDPMEYAPAIPAASSATPAALTEYAMGYTFRGEGNGCAL